MPRCPKCRCHFRTLDDEEGMHECPRCGYTGHDEPEPYEGWSRFDFAEAEADQRNDIEREDQS